MACSMRVTILAQCNCGRVLFDDEDNKEWTLLYAIKMKVKQDTPKAKCDFCKGERLDYSDPKGRLIPTGF